MPQNKSKKLIVAVDGPAGSGKSSLCKRLCEKFGFFHLNTGSIYRAFGYLFFDDFKTILKEGIQSSREDAENYIEKQFIGNEKLEGILREFKEHLEWDGKKIFYLGKDLSPFLYTKEASEKSSIVAQDSVVREALKPVQRHLADLAKQSVLVDGRDIGTVIFPHADLKFFLTASIPVRAHRRLEQLGLPAADLQRIQKEIESRDAADSKRNIAPLRQPEDAIVLDSSEKTLDEMVHIASSYIEEK